MIYQFGPFELDIATVELRNGDKACCLEPQVFALLALLVENRERLVSKEEIIDKVWDGRVVSDAAVASRVKSVRQALGDTGKSQRLHPYDSRPGIPICRRCKSFTRHCGTLGRRFPPSLRPRPAAQLCTGQGLPDRHSRCCHSV